ncbi:MAG: acyl-CoA dehydrogenase, partial [Lentisphaeria bacterium]|nr:acyl-CoA dehydrogenase [Lentisphaeria bacterium]
MLNYFSDNQDLEFTLKNLDLAEITGMLEKNYTTAEKFEAAPVDFKDALDNYERALKVIGEIAG